VATRIRVCRNRKRPGALSVGARRSCTRSRTDWVSASDAPGDKRLAAYVIPAVPGDVATLAAQLVPQLPQAPPGTSYPDYMQAGRHHAGLKACPEPSTARCDRRALPAPVPEQLMRARAIVYPRTPAQETLAAIWSKLLGVKEVSIDDTIFELGGDSLLIFRIITLANQAWIKADRAPRISVQNRWRRSVNNLRSDSNSQVAQKSVGTSSGHSSLSSPQTTDHFEITSRAIGSIFLGAVMRPPTLREVAQAPVEKMDPVGPGDSVVTNSPPEGGQEEGVYVFPAQPGHRSATADIGSVGWRFDPPPTWPSPLASKVLVDDSIVEQSYPSYRRTP